MTRPPAPGTADFAPGAGPEYVAAPDGVPIAVYTDGDRSRPPVLLVHGFPDTHRAWDAVAAALATDHYVVRYDVRGAGASGRPASLAGYHLDRLADDLFAVADAVSPGRPVHLAGHDWGSIQAWHAATDPRAAMRIASYTTISGPCLDHVGFWFRDRLTRRSPRDLASLGLQSALSWYVWVFQVPMLPPLAWRLGLARAWPGLLRLLEGVTPRDGLPAATLAADAAHGIGLYRANMRQRLLHPSERHALVPVQLITVTGDHYVSPALAGSDLDRWASDLTRRTIPGTHWSILEGTPVAEAIREFAGRQA
ncbi:MAG: alpha/beta fold hydrolase [Nocardiopsaceae bacterium]|nr:alpha/beta fold hydrolase [Nocardiopsaceae bacterium]